MTPPRESNVVDAILRYLRALPDGHARKNHGTQYGTAGEPDVDACVRGRCVKIEVKRPGAAAKVTALQRAALDRWSRAGAVAFVATSVDDVRLVLVGHGLVDDARPPGRRAGGGSREKVSEALRENGSGPGGVA